MSLSSFGQLLGIGFFFFFFFLIGKKDVYSKNC